MNKRNRKKQLRHKVKQQAFFEKVQQKQNPPTTQRTSSRNVPRVSVDIEKVTKKSSAGVSEHIKEYYKEIETIEKEYNSQLDTYIAQEIEKRYEELKPIEQDYPEIEFVNFSARIKSLGLKVSKDDVRVVPNLNELTMMVTNWKRAFERFMAEIPDNYADSDFGSIARDEFLDNITEHFIDNQDDPVALMNYSPNLKSFVEDIRQRYINEGASAVMFDRGFK